MRLHRQTLATVHGRGLVVFKLGESKLTTFNKNNSLITVSTSFKAFYRPCLQSD